MKASRIKINGIVQGVGFRPFVFRIANQNNLNGWVQNTSGGVVIEIEGENIAMDRFLTLLQQELPPLARIETFYEETINPNGYIRFEIRPSKKNTEEYSLVPPDAAICPDCARELFDPTNRRFRYPFINCTNCGPRFTIIKDMPYDRPNTTMSSFTMCDDCNKEYHDPLDRRFHAQPIACPECGPQISLVGKSGVIATKNDAILSARTYIQKGYIVAIKGLGGYLLACDAHNQETLQKLRERKRRSQKPFALMAFNLEMIRKYCFVNNEEQLILQSMQMPIVLLTKNNQNNLPNEVAPSQNTLGFMLPYTPLHLLLCEPDRNYPDVLVMTSANISDEPILYRDEEIYRLFELSDFVLTHDRPIHIRTDDSVVREFAGTITPIRRSRGFAPESVSIPAYIPDILSVGALLKNTITITHQNRAFVSPYIGDLENIETYEAFESTIAHMKSLYQVSPLAVVSDLHLDYLSTQFAQKYSSDYKIPHYQVQHHHAHMAACLAENNWNGTNAIGLCFDGTGLGTDGSIWGGEVLIGNYSGYFRYAHLKNMPLPGGDSAIKKPYRIALSYLTHLGFPLKLSLPPVSYSSSGEISILSKQIQNRINVVHTSSMGRLFDAVSSIIGVCHEISYEGQAAIELENIVDLTCTDRYIFSVNLPDIDIQILFQQILLDLYGGTPAPIMAAKFHNSIASLSLDICMNIKEEKGIDTVALSGGVWQNNTLLKKTTQLLLDNGFHVLIHRVLPANDSSISYGQAVITGMIMNERN